MGKQCWWILSCVFFLLLGGCPKNSQQKKDEIKGSRSQLVERVNQFNKFLRWRSFTRAKAFVPPGLRAAYVLKWEKERGTVRISEFAVRDITMVKEGMEAVVLVMQKGFHLNNPTVQVSLLQQKWIAREGVWFYLGNLKAKPKAKASPTSKTSVKKRPSPPKKRIMLPKSQTID